MIDRTSSCAWGTARLSSVHNPPLTTEGALVAPRTSPSLGKPRDGSRPPAAVDGEDGRMSPEEGWRVALMRARFPDKLPDRREPPRPNRDATSRTPVRRLPAGPRAPGPPAARPA